MKFPYRMSGVNYFPMPTGIWKFGCIALAPALKVAVHASLNFMYSSFLVLQAGRKTLLRSLKTAGRRVVLKSGQSTRLDMVAVPGKRVSGILRQWQAVRLKN